MSTTPFPFFNSILQAQLNGLHWLDEWGNHVPKTPEQFEADLKAEGAGYGIVWGNPNNSPNESLVAAAGFVYKSAYEHKIKEPMPQSPTQEFMDWYKANAK